MKEDNLQNALLQLDFSEEESNLYVFLLKNSDLTPLKISKELKIPRTNVYRILDKLIQKNLIAKKDGKNGVLFYALSPDKILEFVNKKERELMLIKISVPTIINQLKSIYSEKENVKEAVYFQTSDYSIIKKVLKELFLSELQIFSIRSDIFLEESLDKKTLKEFIKLSNNKKRENDFFITNLKNNSVNIFIRNKNSKLKIIEGEFQENIFVNLENFILIENLNNKLNLIKISNKNLSASYISMFKLFL